MSYERVKLAEVASIRGGKRLPAGRDFAATETTHPYIRARDIGGGKVEVHDPVYLDEATAQKLARYTVNKGDVCLTIVGANVGEMGVVPPHLDGANLTENAVKIVTNGKADQTFLKYALLGDDAMAQMKVLAGGAAQPKLGIYKIETIEFPCPPLQLQRRIADILSAYDELIENNQRRIRILEDMAHSLYREWFVHFRYPGHESVPLADSPLGQIPQGWEVKKLYDVLELNYGKALKKDDRRDGEYPVFGSSGIVGTHDTALVKGPGIIVGRKGNVGSVFWCDDDFFVIDTAYFVTSSLPLRFLFYVLPTLNFINSDAAVPGLSRNQAYTLEILVPPTSLLNQFCELAGKFECQAATLQRQTANLRRTRDLLLPRLLSGGIAIEKFNQEDCYV